MNYFTIRKATAGDLPEIFRIYARAREFMKANGNESQWGLPSPGKTVSPAEDKIRDNVEKGLQLICMAEGDADCTDCTGGRDAPQVAATFAFTIGIPESAYSSIYDGSWPDDGNEPYGVVHSFATSGTVKGAGKFCLAWCLDRCGYLKIDTHPNNKPMRSLLEKCGFTYCGKILMPEVQNDDIGRIAFWARKSPLL